MVSQTEMRLARYRREEPGRWICLEHRAPDHRADLQSMGCALGLAETYEPLVFREDPWAATGTRQVPPHTSRRASDLVTRIPLTDWPHAASSTPIARRCPTARKTRSSVAALLA